MAILTIEVTIEQDGVVLLSTEVSGQIPDCPVDESGGLPTDINDSFSESVEEDSKRMIDSWEK